MLFWWDIWKRWRKNMRGIVKGFWIRRRRSALGNENGNRRRKIWVRLLCESMMFLENWLWPNKTVISRPRPFTDLNNRFKTWNLRITSSRTNCCWTRIRKSISTSTRFERNYRLSMRSLWMSIRSWRRSGVSWWDNVRRWKLIMRNIRTWWQICREGWIRR